MHNQEERSEILNRADSAYARGSLDEALELYRQVLAEDDTVAWAHSRTGAILAQKDDLAGAEVHLRRAIELDPNLPQAHSNLGNLDYARGDFAAALEKYQLAVKLDPDNPTFHENLHAAYKKLGRISEAVDAIKRAQRLKRQQVRAEVREDMASLGSRVKRRIGCLPIAVLMALLLALLVALS